MLGEIIGEKYSLERSIGSGGMGEVYEARHVFTGRAVALKLLFRTRPDGEAQAAGRFLREARAAGGLNAPNLVQVFDAGTDHETERNYLVMELLHGENLLDLVKRVGPLPPRIALCIAGQAARGLAKAHAHGVIHRDIKPANIFLAMAGDEVVVKVLDFGIAKITALGESGHHQVAASLVVDPSTSLTQVGAIVGSPHYMSPEQAQGLDSLDHRSDIFSLGAVLYRLLSGKTPHSGVETLIRLLAVICTEPARPIREVAPWVPDPVSRILERAVAIHPDDRYASAEELERDIVALVGDLRLMPHEIGALGTEHAPRMRMPSTPAIAAAMADPAESAPGLVTGPPLAGPVPGSGTHALPPVIVHAAHASVAPRAPHDSSVGVVVPPVPPVHATHAGGEPRRGSPASSVVLAVALGVALVGGVGLWRARARGANQATASTEAPSSATASAAPSPPSNLRRYWVSVQPHDVRDIMVDGRNVPLTSAGYIEVSGEVGTRHTVVLKLDTRTHVVEVTLLADSVTPAAIVFPPAAPPEDSAAPGRAEENLPTEAEAATSRPSQPRESYAGLPKIPPLPMPPPRRREEPPEESEDLPLPIEIPLPSTGGVGKVFE